MLARTALWAFAAASLVFAQTPGRGGLRVKMAADGAVPGDPERGRSIVEGKGECLKCHRIADHGSRLGADLTEIATQRTIDELQKALTEPPREARPQYQLYRVVTKEGATITGKLMNQDTWSVQMLDSNERLVSFQKTNLRSYGAVQPPIMASYRGKLSEDELTNVIAYLATLKGPAMQ
jgi:putative heme-binding domain-containing protein